MAPQAVDCWLKAIKRALGRAAYAEAFAQIDSGVELLDAAPDSRERTRMLAKLELQRAFAFSAAHGQGSAQAGKAFAEAQALCERLGEATPESFYALYGAYTFHVVRAEIEPALGVARESLRIAQITGDPACITAAHRIVGSAYFWRGLPREAAHHFEQVLRLYDALRDRESPLAAVADNKAIGLSFLAMATALLGYPDKALALHDEALRHADRVGLPHNSAHALHMLAVTCWILRDHERGIEYEQGVIALAEKYAFPLWRAYAKGWLGGHLAARGQIDDAIALLEAGVAESETSGSRLGRASLSRCWRMRSREPAAGRKPAADTTMHSRRSKPLEKASSSRGCARATASSCLPATTPARPRPRLASARCSKWRARKGHAGGSCAPRSRSRGSCIRKARRARRASCLRRSTHGSPKVSTRAT